MLSKFYMPKSIFIAVLFTSLLGATVFGVSLNKIALIPFGVGLLLEFFGTNKHIFRVNRTEKKLLSFYIGAILSCLIGLFNDNSFSGYTSKLVSYAVQLLICYIPIALFLWSSKNRENYFKCFQKSVVTVCRIHCIWALVQFISYSLYSFDLNSFVFTNLLHGALGGKWTSWSWENGTLALRVTGLNYDSAYLAIILIFGFIFDKRKAFRVLYFAAAVLSMSRTGIFTMTLAFVVDLYNKNSLKTIDSKKIFKMVVSIGVISLVFLYLYNTLESVQYQVDYAMSRVADINSSEKSESTVLHQKYIPYSLLFYLSYLNPIQKLIGVGPRVAGIVFAENESNYSAIVLNQTQQYTAWPIECDFAEVLLGYGILGFILYYGILYDIYKGGNKQLRLFSISMVVMGIMYDYVEMTFFQLALIFILSIKESKKSSTIKPFNESTQVDA